MKRILLDQGLAPRAAAILRDLMTSVTGVSFDEAWEDRCPGDLLRNKDATGRAKDRIDAEELRKQKPST